jgi:hypothetical protein
MPGSSRCLSSRAKSTLRRSTPSVSTATPWFASRRKFDECPFVCADVLFCFVLSCTLSARFLFISPSSDHQPSCTGRCHRGAKGLYPCCEREHQDSRQRAAAKDARFVCKTPNNSQNCDWKWPVASGAYPTRCSNVWRQPARHSQFSRPVPQRCVAAAASLLCCAGRVASRCASCAALCLILFICFVTRFAAGIGIINAAHTVKFTSHFELSSKEVDLLVAALDRVCQDYKKH